MSRFVHVLVIGVSCIAMLSRPSFAADAPAAARPLEIADVLSIKEPEKLLIAANERMERLATLLKQAVDEPTAQSARAAAERTYVEMELIGTRMTMFPRPTDAERAKYEKHHERYEAAKEALRVEIARIAELPAVRAQLISVIRPITAQRELTVSAKAMSLMSVLQTLRAQVELYKLEHRDEMPDFRTHAWAQLTNSTDENGAYGNGKRKYGPYLQSPPRNPLTGGSGILLVRGKPKAGFRQADPKFGFVVDVTNGLVWALDADGRIFDDMGMARASVD